MRRPLALNPRVISRAHLSLFAVVVVWAGSFSAIKGLLDEGVAAGDVAILRYAIAAPGFALILWHARGLPDLAPTRRASDWRRGCVVVGYHLFLNLAGTWRYERGRVRIEPFERLDAAVRRELRAEAERLAAFHE